MSWFSELSGLLGIPASAVGIATGMYSAGLYGEKKFRVSAKKEIARLLSNPAWIRAARPQELIEKLFTYTFGEKHISSQCMKMSAFGTILSLTVLTILVYKKSNLNAPTREDLTFIILVAFIGDYISLAKTRLILSFAIRHTFPGPIATMVTDVISTLFICFMMSVTVQLILVIPEFMYKTKKLKSSERRRERIRDDYRNCRQKFNGH